MKRIFCFSLLSLLATAPMMRAQDSSAAADLARKEAEENYKSLKGHVEDLIDARTEQDKRLSALAKEISELREQASKPTGNYASQDDLKRLAEAIQEIDKKREADKELILKEIAKLGKVVTAPPPVSHPKPQVVEPLPVSSGNDLGYTYKIKKGDTYSVIAQAYREQGIKVTSEQIAKANPNVDSAKLKVNQEIFIPAPKKP
jgi:LysM repeat protein